MEYVVNGKVRDLQAALFPVQPIPGNNLTSQCLHAQIGIERKDLNSELSLTSGYVKYRDSKDNFESFFIDSNHLNGLEPISQEARWPVECQVLEEKIHHIEDGPEEPEPFYVPTGKEPRPKPIGEESGTVIFRYVPMTSTNYFSRSCIGGSEVQSTVPPQQTYYEEPAAVDATSTDGGDAVQAPNCVTTPPPSSRSSDLCFESRFESGNLGKVIKITDTFYQLHLRKDLYTQKHMQWFYFRITNMRNDVTYRLSIVNLVKEDSLYNEGLRPLLYSTKEATTHAIGWRRCGENISYYRNDTSDDDKDKHTLTFNITFPHDQDVVYLAHCYPYTYTKLQNYLTKIAKDPVKSRYTKLRLLCRSLAGNSVYYLTITSPTSNDEGHNHRKKGIVLTARVHPGETPSSWIMKGMIDFLTGDSNQARELRDRFIFKLIPMLNPDGVIVGNNRCSLSGKDLNRQYRTVMRESYPSVWHTKLMIRRLMEECGIAMYCDLHAHSRKHNIFIYGCENKRPGFPARLAEQVFPLMLHKNSADKFSFENCKFHIEKGKEGTGRVVVWLMGIQNSYTMEASLGGTVLGSRNGTHFCTQDYEQFGKAFCETLIDFSDDDPSKEKLRNKILARLTQEGSSADEPTNIELTDYSSDEGDTSDDSSDEEGKKRTGIDDRRYLTVPPPSPVLLKPATADPLDKTVKRKSVRPRLCVRKSVRSRKAINLPTTDPGSDLYMSDTADEINVYSATEMKSKSSGDDEDLGNFGKENRPRKKSEHELPVLVRPRSLSLGEEILAVDLARKNKRRYRQRRLPRPLRTLSPVNQTSQDVQVKLLPFKYNQIWTGLGSNYQEMSEVSFANTPLSFGISKMVAECQKNSELLLESCSKKLEELSYIQNELKKQKKKVRKKPTTKVIAVPTITSPDDDSKATIKKKKVRVKRTKILKTGLEPADNNGIVLSSDTIDTLKLFGTAKLPKIQTKPKSDSKKKLNKTIIAAAIATTKLKPKPVVDSAGDSSGSENSSVIKCKSEKKTKKSATRKKCTLSAKNNSVKKEIKQISTQ